MPDKYTIANWELEAVQVTTDAGDFDINTAHLDTIGIFEGLSSPAVTGTMTLKDYDGALEVQEIFAGDDIKISIKSKGESRTLTFIGKIYSVESMQSGAQTAPVTSFHFCSEWWFNALTRQVSKAWKNKTVAEMLEELIVECGGTFQGMYPTPTAKIERLVTPLWTPAHIIKWILKWASGDNGEAGYVLWDSLLYQEPICMSMGWVLDGNFGTSNKDLILNTPNLNYAGSFNTLWVESLYDEMRYLNQGVFQTDVWCFDYDRTKLYNSVGTADDVNSPHLGFQMPITLNSASDTFKSIRGSTWYPNTQKLVPEKEFKNAVDASRNNRLQMIFSDMVKMSALLPGDTARVSGELVKINYPSVNKKVGGNNQMLEGEYIIRDIQHILTFSSFVQAITFASDGINITQRKDLKKW